MGISSQSKVKFDESVELSMSLGVDPKQSSQSVRGTVKLPHGSGKDVKVLVFTEKPEEALKLGADHAGLEDLIAKIKDGWTMHYLLRRKRLMEGERKKKDVYP